MIRYELIKMGNPRFGHGTYGILGKEEAAGSWIPVVTAAPFSDNREAVDKLAQTCTALQLSPEHLFDVVADFIIQSCIKY